MPGGSRGATPTRKVTMCLQLAARGEACPHDPPDRRLGSRRAASTA